MPGRADPFPEPGEELGRGGKALPLEAPSTDSAPAFHGRAECTPTRSWSSASPRAAAPCGRVRGPTPGGWSAHERAFLPAGAGPPRLRRCPGRGSLVRCGAAHPPTPSRQSPTVEPACPTTSLLRVRSCPPWRRFSGRVACDVPGGTPRRRTPTNHRPDGHLGPLATRRGRTCGLAVLSLLRLRRHGQEAYASSPQSRIEAWAESGREPGRAVKTARPGPPARDGSAFQDHGW